MLLSLNVKQYTAKDGITYVNFRCFNKDVCYDVKFETIDRPILYKVGNAYRAYIVISSTSQFDIKDVVHGTRSYPTVYIKSWDNPTQEETQAAMQNDLSKIQALKDEREKRKRDFLEI